MGFSSEIKEQAFVASARRCCICKEFLGINIEVHHIIPVSKGGKDTFENAIPLCFDCHANAGHYNSKHPRGSKFSPEELRKHRDLWYNLVATGQFSIGELEISQQFLLTNSFDIISEIIKGDFSNFPFNEVKLYQNELYNYLKEIDVFTKIESDFYNYYESEEEYILKFPDAILETSKYGITNWIRIPSISELKEKFYSTEYVANYMIRNNAEPEEFSLATFYECGCSEGNYEIFDLKKAKVVFLAIFNKSEKTLSIKSITETYKADGGFISLEEIENSTREKNTNNLQLEVGKCLLIPYCILLTGLEIDYNAEKRFIYKHISTGQSQDVRAIELTQESKSITIGVRNFIKQIQFEHDNFLTAYPIKSLDPKNLLLISRFWECGSCPHLFGLRNASSKWEYICEVFRDNPGQNQEFVFNSIDFEKLKIVELENEITELESISINGILTEEQLILIKGDEHILSVKPNDIIKIKGKFSLIEGVKYVHDSTMKKQKILHYISDN